MMTKTIYYYGNDPYSGNVRTIEWSLYDDIRRELPEITEFDIMDFSDIEDGCIHLCIDPYIEKTINKRILLLEKSLERLQSMYDSLTIGLD